MVISVSAYSCLSGMYSAISSKRQFNILQKSSMVRILRYLLFFIRVKVFGLILCFSLSAYVVMFFRWSVSQNGA